MNNKEIDLKKKLIKKLNLFFSKKLNFQKKNKKKTIRKPKKIIT